MSTPPEKLHLPGCPFPGIDPFTYAGRGVFFARETEARSLIHLVVMFRGVLLYAASTIGKSSLVDAGLIQLAIEEGFQPTRIRVQPTLGEEIIAERISENVAWKSSFLQSILESDETQERVVLSVEKFLTAVRQGAAVARPLLIFDQFEEWVTLFDEAFAGQAGKDARVSQERICEAITSLISDESLPVKVLMVFREDYLAQLTPYFKRCPSLPDQHLQLRPLAGNQIYRAIRGPFDKYPGIYRPELSPALARKVQTQFEDRSGGSDISLPEVQIVCQSLFQSGKEGEELERFFDDQGGVRGILERFLEGKLKSLPDDQHDAAVGLLSRMVTSAGTRNVISEDDILGRVEHEDGLSSELLREALAGLEAKTKLVRRTRRREVYYYEITSEFLVGWIGKQAQQRKRSIEEKKLLEAQQRAEAERRRAEEQARYAKRLLTQRRTLVVISLLALFALLVSGYYWRKTTVQQKVALAHQLDWIAEKNITTDPELSVLLSVQAASQLHDSGIPIPPSIEEVLRKSLSGAHLELEISGHHYPVEDIALDTRKNTLLSANSEGTITLWDLNTGNKSPEFSERANAGYAVAISPDRRLFASCGMNKECDVLDAVTGRKRFSLSGHKERIFAVTFSVDGKIIVTASGDNTAKLWEATTGKELTTFSGHGDKVAAVAISPNGKYVATGSEDKTARLWDASTGKELFTLSNHSDFVRGVSFSPDGKKLITASFDNSVKVWDVSTGILLNTLAGHTWAVNCVAFSPDGKYIASGSWDRSVIIWDAETGKEVSKHTDFDGAVSKVAFNRDGKTIVAASLDGSITVRDTLSAKILSRMSEDSSAIYAAAYSRDGQRVVTSGVDTTARVWDARTGYPLLALVGGHTDGVRAVAFSYDGKRIVTGSVDHTAIVWDAVTGKELLSLPRQEDIVLKVAFSPNGKFIATVSGKAAKIWDADNGKELFTLSGHMKTVYGVAFSPDGKRLATSSGDKTVKLWDLSNGRQLSTLVGHKDIIFGVAFSHDGTKIATGSWDKTAKVWELKTGKDLQTLSGHMGAVVAVAFSPNDSTLATGSIDKTVKLWHLKGEGDRARVFDQSTRAGSAEENATLYGHTEWVSSVDFSPDGEHLISVGFAGVAKIWRITEEKEAASYEIHAHDDPINCVAFSGDGHQFATASYDQTVKVWNIRTGKEELHLGHPKDVEAQIIFSPNGKLLSSTSPESRINIWSTETGQRLHTLDHHKSAITTVAFSPDSNRIITGSDDKKGIVWDTRTGHELFVLSGHTAPITVVTFSPDGTTIATASSDGNANIWDAATGKPLLRLSGHAKSLNAIAFSPDGHRIVTASSDETAKVWDARTGKVLFTLAGHQGAVFSVTFSPDGENIATGSRDMTAKLWKAADGTLLSTLPKHDWWVETVEFNKESNILATVSGIFSKTVRLWSVKTGKPLHVFRRLSWSNTPFAFSPDGKQLATARGDKTVQLFNVTADKELAVLAGHQQDVVSVAFSPAGKLLASLGQDNNVKMWSLENSREIFSIPGWLAGHNSSVNSVAFSSDGMVIASAGDDEQVRLWDRKTGQESLVLSSPTGAVRSLVFTRDGRSLVAGVLAKKEEGQKTDSEVEVWTWNLATRTTTPSPLKYTAAVASLAFSPDGKYVVSGTENGQMKMWNIRTGEEATTFSGIKYGINLNHTDAITDIAYGPDGKFIATASADTTSKLWDSATGKLMSSISGHTNKVQAVAFSADGKRIATGGEDKIVKVWDATTGDEVWSGPLQAEPITHVGFSQAGSQLVTTDAKGSVLVYALDVQEWIRLASTRVTRSLTLEECNRYLNEAKCPTNIESIRLLVQGREQARRGNFNEALKSLRKAQELQPALGVNPEEEAGRGVALVLVAQGMDLRRKDESEGAVEKFVQALRFDPKVSFEPISSEDKETSNRLVQAGVAILRKGKLHTNEAINALSRALTVDPGNGRCRLLIGAAYLSLEQYDKAIEYLQFALQEYPDAPYIYAMLGAAYSKKDSTEAMKNVNKSLQDDQYYGFGLEMLAHIESDRGEYQDALSQINKVMVGDPDYVAALSNSGGIYFDKLYEYGSAYERFKKALELEPDNVELLANFAEANVPAGRYREAEELAQKALAKPDKLDQGSQLAMRNVMIVSAVMDKSYDKVQRRLREFISVYNSVKRGYKSTWSYSGIEHFVLNQTMDNKYRQVLVALINALKKEKDKDLELEEFERFIQ